MRLARFAKFSLDGGLRLRYLRDQFLARRDANARDRPIGSRIFFVSFSCAHILFSFFFSSCLFSQVYGQKKSLPFRRALVRAFSLPAIRTCRGSPRVERPSGSGCGP